MTNLEDQWKKWIEEHLSHEQTITNCMITAAYICYCGPFDRDIRMRMCNFFASCCLKHEIPKEPQQIFKDFSLPEFLFSPIQLKEIELLRLPGTENILENGCFLIEDKSYDNWPLICDSSRRSIDWLKTFYKDKQLFVLREYEMKSVLETCLSEGHFLLLTDCDVAKVMSNRKLETVLRNKNRFINSDKPFKLNLGNQEIECNPSFRLFLHTGSESTRIPDDLAAYTLVVNFKLIRPDLEEELLDRFLLLAKPRIDSERYGLLQEKVNTLKIIDPLEQDITNFLASEVDLLNSVEPTKKLSELKKSYDEAVDSNLRIEIAEEPLIKTRESYREIALRGAICFDVISCLKELNSNYILSYKQFIQIFDDSLYQFERSSTPQVISKLTSGIFSCLSRMMNESDRKVFAILLSMEIEASAGRLRAGEREFAISPLYGAMMIQSVTGKQINEHKHWQSKKSFDWMLEDQFLNLQYLAISHSWFSDPFDRMSRDGRETQWRSLCESETPENVSLPDKLDEVLSPIQRFCIVRAVRGDRILQISLSFVSSVLGKSFVSSNTLDFEAIYSESTAQKPIILMYLEESETIRRYFSCFAKTKVGSNFSIIDINSLGIAGDNQIKRTLIKPMEEGSWVLLQNCHNSSKILNQIESLLIENSNHKNLDPNFRCWISLLQTEDKPPTSLMLNSVRAFIGPSQSMKESIIRSFNWVDAEQVKLSNKPEWPILLHNLCYFHSCLRLRSRYHRCGWNSPLTLNFTTEEFLESLRTATQEYLQIDSPSRTDSVKSISDLNKNISLQAIKFIVADLIYGGSASNEYDLQAIESIAEYWISSIATRKDFELSKLKYKIPNPFCAQPAKIASLQQSLENIPPLQLEAPEACHLLPSIETVLGDDVFIMTRLNKLIDALPSSNTILKVFERPLTPFDNSAVPHINSNSHNPIVYPLNSFSTSSYMASQNKKQTDLNEYCLNILTTKIPKTYTKDQLNEKVKKNGGWNTYNYWIVNEMNLITNLINTVKNHLTLIKNATESRKLGWDWSPDIVEIADSLFYQQIPKSWCLLSGSKTYFPHYNLGSFINDLQIRFQHIEKCLTMGREKTPAFNLGAFYHPEGLLSLFKFETIKNKNQSDDVGCVEPMIFQSEMTSRDKEHLRDPPKEGLFVYGLYLWGCHWEKSTSELIDQPVKFKDGFMALPVIHLTCWLESEKPLLNDTTKAQDLYKCPVYTNKKERDESIFEIDMLHAGVQAQKWAMRGVCATLKPY